MQEAKKSMFIETKRLQFLPITKAEYHNFFDIYRDPEIMVNFAYGVPYLKEKIEADFLVECKKWEHLDPRCSFALYTKSVHRTFIGFIRLYVTSIKNQLELGYSLTKESWGKGYGFESVEAIIKQYIPSVNKSVKNFEMEPAQSSVFYISQVVATAHPHNIGSIKILDKLDFKKRRFENSEPAVLSILNKLPSQFASHYYDLIDQAGRERTLGVRYNSFRYFFIKTY